MSATSSASCMSATCRKRNACIRRKLFAEKVMPKLRNMFPDYAERRPLLVQADREAGDAGQSCRPSAISPRSTACTEERGPWSSRPSTPRMSRCAISKAATARRWSSCTAQAAYAAGDPFFAKLAVEISCLCAAASRLWRFRGMPRAARHARFHAAQLGRGRCAGLEEPDPRRPFDGRHDRGRDGGDRAA